MRLTAQSEFKRCETKTRRNVCHSLFKALLLSLFAFKSLSKILLRFSGHCWQIQRVSKQLKFKWFITFTTHIPRLLDEQLQDRLKHAENLKFLLSSSSNFHRKFTLAGSMWRCCSSASPQAFAAALSAVARLSLLPALQINQNSGGFLPQKAPNHFFLLV